MVSLALAVREDVKISSAAGGVSCGREAILQ